MEFASLMPYMDKDVAMRIIDQFPAYTETCKELIASLSETCDKVLETNHDSHKEVIAAYKKVLERLDKDLDKDGLSNEERKELHEQMISVADKIADESHINKDFLASIMKYKGYIIMGAFAIGATILGVNVKGKLPKIGK